MIKPNGIELCMKLNFKKFVKSWIMIKEMDRLNNTLEKR